MDGRPQGEDIDNIVIAQLWTRAEVSRNLPQLTKLDQMVKQTKVKNWRKLTKFFPAKTKEEVKQKFKEYMSFNQTEKSKKSIGFLT